MTFAVVESTATTSTPLQSNHTVNLPSGIVDNDLLLIFVDIEDTAAGVTFPGGWTQFFFVTDGINRMWGFWRDADGTEGATISVTTTPFAERGVYNAYRISGAEDPDNQPPQAATVTGNDCPNLTPTGGAKDYLWMAALGTAGGAGSPPANYANEVSVANFNSMSSARRELNAASEDPGVYSGGGGGRITATIAIHPLALIPSADLTGTITDDSELDIRNGTSTIILDITNDTWVADGAAFNAQRQAIIDGLDSGGSETNGWDAAVLAALDVTDVVRTSNTRVTITMPPVPDYNITANETITATVPASALVTSADPLIAAPTFDITFLTESAAVLGTIYDYVDEAGIRAGTFTIILTLTNVQWEADVGADNTQTQDLIDGLESDLAETLGWDLVVKAGLTFANVARNSDTVVTITVPAFPTYSIDANETITVTIPATALDFPVAITGNQTFLITDLADTAPVVEGTNSSTHTTGSPHTVDLPAGIVAGELLVVLFSSASGLSDATLSGWTRLAQLNIVADPNGRITFAVFFKKADGTEGATVSVATPTGSQNSAHNTYRISGMENPDTRTPEISSIPTAVTEFPNPPALTPTGGAKHYLWLAIISSNKSFLSGPSNYTDPVNVTATGDVGTASMRLARNIATENPGTPVPPLTDTFTVNIGVDPDITAAAVLAIHPLVVDVSGTIISAAADELDIRNGGSTIILNLTTDNWVALGGAFDAQRQNIIDGLDSDGAEANGWDAVARPAIQVGDVVRTSNKVVTITLPAVPGYSVTANETITATVPASALAVLTSPEEADPPFVITFLAESAALTGTVTASADETDVRVGLLTIVLTLTNVQWEANVGADNPQTQAIIDGLDSDLAEATGWDALVKGALTFANVVRTSDFVVTITLPAVPGYNIGADETITATIPASALDFPDPLIASPAFVITNLPSGAAVFQQSALQFRQFGLKELRLRGLSGPD